MKLPAFVLALVAAGASAQSYPSKPIRLVVPFAPGGSSTLVARFMSEEMAKGLGTSIVIENKPGGGGTIAMQEVGRATPGPPSTRSPAAGATTPPCRRWRAPRPTATR